MLTADELAALQTVAEAGDIHPDLDQPNESIYPAGLTADGLLALAEKEWLAKTAVSYCPCCPQCQGATLRVNGRCPTCQSANLSAVPLAHHIPCAAIFEAPDGLNEAEACPKCGSRVAKDRQSFETVGESYYCEDCSAHFPELGIYMGCPHCQINHALHDVFFRRFYRYCLTAAGRKALEQAR